jgi:hypothetical protein
MVMQVRVVVVVESKQPVWSWPARQPHRRPPAAPAPAASAAEGWRTAPSKHASALSERPGTRAVFSTSPLARPT